MSDGRAGRGVMTRREARKLRRTLKCLFPNESKQRLMDFLWGATSFPFVKSYRHLHRQVYEAHRRGGGTIEGAFGWSHAELDKAVQRAKREGTWPKSRVVNGRTVKA